MAREATALSARDRGSCLLGSQPPPAAPGAQSKLPPKQTENSVTETRAEASETRTKITFENQRIEDLGSGKTWIKLTDVCGKTDKKEKKQIAIIKNETRYHWGP